MQKGSSSLSRSVLAASSVFTSAKLNWVHHRFPFGILLICPTFYYNLLRYASLWFWLKIGFSDSTSELLEKYMNVALSYVVRQSSDWYRKEIQSWHSESFWTSLKKEKLKILDKILEKKIIIKKVFQVWGKVISFAFRAEDFIFFSPQELQLLMTGVNFWLLSWYGSIQMETNCFPAIHLNHFIELLILIHVSERSSRVQWNLWLFIYLFWFYAYRKSEFKLRMHKAA